MPTRQGVGSLGGSTPIDKSVLKFIFALVIVGVSVEVIDSFDRRVAWLLVVIILLGVFLNNPLAIALLNVSANSLGSETK